MTSIHYTVLVRNLLDLGWTDAEVVYYADKLKRVLGKKVGHIGSIEVVCANRLYGGRTVQILTDDDGLDIDSLDERVREIANNVFGWVCE